MNEQIRSAIEQHLQQSKVSQTELAARLGVTRHALNRALRDRQHGGKVPRFWQALLDELGLELVVRPRKDAA